MSDHTATTQIAENLPVTATSHQDEHEGVPPPSYDEAVKDSDDEDEYIEPDVSLTIDAAQHIRGTGNLVPSGQVHVAQAVRFSTMLINTVCGTLKDQATSSASLNPIERRRPLQIKILVDCKISVVGDRNIVGAFAINHKSAASKQQDTACNAAAGVKRPAEEGVDSAISKRIAMEQHRKHYESTGQQD